MPNYPGLLDYLEKHVGACAGSGPEHQFYCPFCLDRQGSESSQRKLWINSVKGKAICYRCDYKAGSTERMLRDLNDGKLGSEELAVLEGQAPTVEGPLDEFVHQLLSGAGGGAPRVLVPVDLPNEYVPLLPFADVERVPSQIQPALAYLQGRGVSWRLVNRYQIGYAATGAYMHRLIFPVWQGGDQVYFTARYCGDAWQKTLNPPNREDHYTRNECIVGYDRLLGRARIALVEGVFDMMAFDYAGALLGKTLSRAQLRLIEGLVLYGLEEVVVALDADAQSEEAHLWRQLSGTVPKVTTLGLTRGDPWDRLGEIPRLLADRSAPTLVRAVKRQLGVCR